MSAPDSLDRKQVFRSAHYREFFEHCCALPGGKGKKHGIVQELAEALNCHPTFVSQVLKGKSELSVEQALSFAQHFSLDEEETHFFVLLVEKSRAGNSTTRSYFAKQMDSILKNRESMIHRIPALQSQWEFPFSNAPLKAPSKDFRISASF